MTDPPHDSALCPPRPRCRWLWLACAAGTAALYLATCQSGPAWQDSGMHQWRVLTGDYWGTRGLALAHPLYIAAGQGIRLIPISDLPTRLNAFSGLGMAVALANLACLCAMLTGRRWIGAVIAAMLAVAHTPWWLGTIAETYSWQVAGLTAELWVLAALIRRPSLRGVMTLGVLNGLGLCLHNLALLPLPVYVATAIVLVVQTRLEARSLALAAGAWLVGAGFFLVMVTTQAVRSGEVIETIVSSLVGGYGKDVLNVSSRLVNFEANAALAGMNFLSVLGPLAVIGWIRFRKVLGAAAWPMAAITGVHVVFVGRYSVPDQFMFLLPSLMLIGVAAGAGLRVLSERPVLRTVAVAVVLLSVAGSVPLELLAAREARRRHAVPHARAAYRDEVRYWMLPWKHDEDSAARFARSALRQLPSRAALWPDTSSRWPLLLIQKIENTRPDVPIQTDGGPLPHPGIDAVAFRKALGDRILYVVSEQPGRVPSAIATRAVFIRERPSDVLLRVRWTPQTAPASQAADGIQKP